MRSDTSAKPGKSRVVSARSIIGSFGTAAAIVTAKPVYFFLPVVHPDCSQPLWSVLSRPGQGHTPWYLLTNQPIHSTDDAWHIVFAYARRWQIELTYRFSKCELAMEAGPLAVG